MYENPQKSPRQVSCSTPRWEPSRMVRQNGNRGRAASHTSAPPYATLVGGERGREPIQPYCQALASGIQNTCPNDNLVRVEASRTSNYNK